MDRPPPRLFGIVATRAPVVAVIRRGPSDWCHVVRWEVANHTVQYGSWLHGTIAPQKCDLSPDGRLLAYSAVNHPGDWEGGVIYDAVSRLPWLTALAAWNMGTTYTRGIHFVDAVDENPLGGPDHGTWDHRRWGLAITPIDQFAVERRRGWTETDASDTRRSGDRHDDTRFVEMAKPRPTRGPSLHVWGRYAAMRALPSWYEGCEYRLVWPDREIELDDVQWADWSHDGDLLVATTAGTLEIRSLGVGELRTVFQHDLSNLDPDPEPPPPEATRW